MAFVVFPMAVQEVELRALLKQGESQKIVEKLKSLNASHRGVTRVTDVYFCRESAQSFDEIEMRDVGSYSLRIRDSINGKSSGSDCTLNMKVVTQYYDHSSWRELETGISSRSDAEAMLRALGFKPYCTIEKSRDNYEYGRFNVILEDIKDFGPAIEVEVLTTKEEGEAAKREIRALMENELGIPKDEIIPKSISGIIMRRISKF